ncbi:unknown [Bacteroides sp. CAG:545]|nr:unknown [Bacteroides sp. CAG:545]
MDIDLLSKMVKELILDNDEVSLPGVGSFVAELVPSSFSDKGYTINPPYKRLSFRKKADASDNVLIDFYAKSNNVDKETASKIVIDFLSEMQKVLELRKSIVFPGLGKLRATKENIFFFVADEDLDIYPEGFGLEPISLKTHEETPAEVSATIAALQDILNPEETESQSGSGEQPEAESGSEEPSEAVSGPEDAPEVTGDGQPESSLEAENESDSELQPEQQATAEESDHQSENESQHDEEREQETVQHVEASSSEDAPEVTGDGQPESSLEAEAESDNELQPEQQATAEESGHQSENDSQSEAEGEQENEPQQEPESDNEPDVPVEQNNSNEPEHPRTEPAKKSRKGWKALIWTAVAIAALAVTFIVGFVILAHIAPDFIDSILYTQEELEIINH